MAGASVSNLEASLPAEFSGIAIEPVAESTHRGGGALDDTAAASAPVLSPTYSDSDVSLFVVAKRINPPNVMDTRGGEGTPPSRENVGGSQKTVSPLVFVLFAKGSFSG